MRATVTAVLISAGVLCAQEPEARDAVPGEGVQSDLDATNSLYMRKVYDFAMAGYEEFQIAHPLLVFFIMSRNFTRNEAELDVKTPAAREGKSPVGEVILDVKRDGSVMMNQRAINAGELKEALAKLAKSNPDQAVVLRGDQDANYKHIVDTLDVCREASIWNVAFAESKPE